MLVKAIWKNIPRILIAVMVCVVLMSCGLSRQITQPAINITEELNEYPTKTSTIFVVQPTATAPINEIQSTVTPPIIESQTSETIVQLPEATPEPDIPEINILDSLRRALAYGGGGGGPPSGLLCEEPTLPSNSSLPAIQGSCRSRFCLVADADHTCDEDTYVLYVFGFPFERVIQLELYNPNGELAGIDEYFVEEFNYDYNSGWIRSVTADESNISRGSATTWGEITVAMIDLWMPAWQPSGLWHAVARSENLFAEGSFTVQPQTRFPGLYIISGEFPNPFDNPYKINNFSSGQEFYILGTGFQPGESYALGIYYIAWGNEIFNAELINGIAVKADDNGIFYSSIVIEESDYAGDYVAYIDFDPSYANAAEAGVDVSFTVPYWQPCSDGSLSYLGPRNTTLINADSPTPAALLAEPFTQAEIIGQLQPGESVIILDGPECQEGMVWWLVESTKYGQSGWMPEADAERYWLLSW